MTTKLVVVQRALGKIGLNRYVFTATPAQLQDAVEQLDQIATEWDGIGIRKGYRLGDDVNDESGLPDTAINGYACALALALAPNYGKVVSPQLQTSATRSFNALMSTGYVIPQVAQPSRMPIGVGNNLGVRMAAYYSGIDQETLTTGNDGEAII